MADKESKEIIAVDLEENKVEAEDDKPKEDNTRTYQRVSFNCFLDAIFFTVRPDNATDVEAMSAQAFGLLVVLIGYLQQLSLIILEELDFGLWGNVFGNINILSLNINFNFGEIEGDIGYLVAVYLLPVTFMFWYIRADLDDAGSEQKFNLLWKVSFAAEIAFVLAFAIVSAVVGVGTGFIFLIPVGYIAFLQVGYKLRARYLEKSFKKDSEEDDDKKTKFFEREVNYNDLAMTISLPVVASAWINVGVLNEDTTVAIIGGIAGGILMLWLLMRLYLRIAGAYALDLSDAHDVLKWIFLGLFLTKDIFNSNGNKDFKESLFFFPLIIYMEKILLAAIPNLASSDLFGADDPDRAAEIGEYVVLGIIFSTFAVVAIFWPLESRMSLRAEIFSRASNVLIFAFAVVNTRIRNNDDTLQEGEDTEEELYVSIVMIIISLYMLCFWLRLLDIKEFLRWIYKSNTAMIYGFWAKYKWSKVATEGDAARIINKRRSQQVTENEFRVLPYFKRFCGFCVKRTRELTAEEHELVQVKNEGKLELTYDKANGVELETLRKLGFWRLEGLQMLSLGDFENSLVDFEVLAESGTLEALFKRGMTGFELQYRYITGEELKFFFDTLDAFPLEQLSLVDCSEKEKNDVTEFATTLAENIVRFENLKVFKYEYDELPEDSAKLLIDNVFSLPNLRVLSLANSKLKDESYNQIAASLVEKEHHLEELYLQDNEPSTTASLQKVVKAAMKTKTLRKMDLSGSSMLTNKMFRLQEDYPELQLVCEGYGYFEFKEDRGEKCNVAMINFKGEAVEYLTKDGFTKELVDEVECEMASLLSTFLYYLNDEWKAVATAHINDTFEIEDYDDEADEDLILHKTLAELVLKEGKGGFMVTHTLERLKKFGADFSMKTSDGKTTLLEMACKSKLKPVKEWGELEKTLDLKLDDLDLDLDLKVDDLDVDLDLKLDDIDLDLDLGLDD